MPHAPSPLTITYWTDTEERSRVSVKWSIGGVCGEGRRGYRRSRCVLPAAAVVAVDDSLPLDLAACWVAG